jgi:hypothetical protein
MSDDLVRGWLKHFVPEYSPSGDLPVAAVDPAELAGERSAAGGAAVVRLVRVGAGAQPAGPPGPPDPAGRADA